MINPKTHCGSLAEVRKSARKSLKTFIAEVLRKCGSSAVKSLKRLCGTVRKLPPPKGASLTVALQGFWAVPA